jgi:hypothetical protein
LGSDKVMAAARAAILACALLTGCSSFVNGCRTKTDDWSVARSMVGQDKAVILRVYGQPDRVMVRGDGNSEFEFARRGPVSHAGPMHFIVSPGGTVVSSHDPEMGSYEECENWRKKSCPKAPGCSPDSH